MHEMQKEKGDFTMGIVNRSEKPDAAGPDNVYRRAKLWQIILYACNGLVGMSVLRPARFTVRWSAPGISPAETKR